MSLYLSASFARFLDNYGDSILKSGRLFAIALLGYFLVGAAYFIYCNYAKAPLTPKAIFGYVFRRDQYTSRTARTDYWNWVFNNSFFAPFLSAFFTIGLGFGLNEFLVEKFGPRAPLTQTEWIIVTVQFITFFVMSDFGGYAMHYAQHRLPLLWSFHRVHHSAESLTIFTAPREHPLDVLCMRTSIVTFGGVSGGMVMYLMGNNLHPAVLPAVFNLGFFFNISHLHHSHIPLSYGKLNSIFYAPVLHQLHHSAEKQHFDKNLGGALAIFDWMFGTLYIPKKDEKYRWGLNDYSMGDANPHLRVRDFYFEPFRYAWRYLRGRSAPVVDSPRLQPAALPPFNPEPRDDPGKRWDEDGAASRPAVGATGT